MVTLTIPLFPFETKVIFYRENTMIKCGALVLLILKDYKNELERQRSPLNYK